jgi:hypothetical protein
VPVCFLLGPDAAAVAASITSLLNSLSIKSKSGLHKLYTANPPCNENRVFPAKFSLQGKTISNENRFFLVKKTSQGKPFFHCRFFPVKVCSECLDKSTKETKPK